MAMVRCCALALLMLLSLSALAAPEARTYTLDNRPARDVADQLRELYPVDELAMTARGQQLILRGEPERLDELGQLIDTMDVAPVQLRIHVRSGSDMNAKRQGGGVSGHGDVVSIQGERRVTSTRSRRERSLVVMDGHSAHITNGQIRTLPVALSGGRNPAAILARVQTRSGFVVSPRMISDRSIELSVMAFENDPGDDIPGYDTEAVLTMRRVEPGRWVELGSSDTTRTGNRSGITYQVGGDRQQNQSFDVRVEIVD